MDQNWKWLVGAFLQVAAKKFALSQCSRKTDSHSVNGLISTVFSSLSIFLENIL